MTLMETKDSLIEKIKLLQADNPDKEVTRKDFRDKTGITDIHWEKHFGTFLEFKAAAGLVAKRLEKRIKSAVAKHSSVDHLKEFNSQKSGWESFYLKPNSERFQTILTGSDIHDKLCDPFYRRLFVETAQRVQPQKIILAGDIFDMYEFSKYSKDVRKVNIIEAITWVHKFLEDLRKAAPNAEIIILAGNHENRLIRYLSEQAPDIMPILSDLHGFTVSSLLGLNKYEVNFISKDSLAVFNESDLKKEIAKNYYVAYECVLFHHFPYAKNWGMAGVNGHHHNHKVEYKFNVLNGPYEWHQLGAGHIRQASYCEGERWSNGFCLIHVDTHTKAVQFEYLDVTHSHCVIGGKWYERTEEEKVKLIATK